jgi:hypothetical protein
MVKEAWPPYEIRIEGHLAPRRLRHFEGVTVRQEASGETVIEGCFRDQAALYGLLSWLQRLGATLLLVKRLEDPNPSSGPTSANPGGGEPCCVSRGRG